MGDEPEILGNVPKILTIEERAAALSETITDFLDQGETVMEQEVVGYLRGWLDALMWTQNAAMEIKREQKGEP